MEAFGKYQIVERIGEGGFGQVFKGWDPQLKRYVAIKTVSLAAPQARERFMREAEIAASLHHPLIVTIFDFGEQDGIPYLVQEFLTGEDLAQRIAGGRTGDLRTRTTWLVQVAEGLRFAHARGVVHRDIKPSNVRVLEDGSIRIMDFGIAKVLDSAHQLTGTNQSIGTSGFISPEQLDGREIDHRADIFSFGVLAYELLTGQRPFAAPTVQATLYRILTEDPSPVASLVPECPARLSACVTRCLQKQRDHRYADCNELLEELRGVLAEPAPSGDAATSNQATTMQHSASPAHAAPAHEHHPAPTRSRAQKPATDVSTGTRARQLAVVVTVVAVLAVTSWAVAGVVGGLLRGDRGTAAASGSGSATVADSANDAAAVAAADSTSILPDPSILPADPPTAYGDTALQSATSDATAALNATDPDPTRRDPTRGDPPPEAGRTVDPGRAADTRQSASSTRPAGTGGADPPRRGQEVNPERVLVLVRGVDESAISTAEQIVLAELLGRSRPVVDPDAVDALRADDAAMRALATAASPAAGVGREYGAGTVVVADLVTDATEAVAGFITGTAVLTAKFYDTASGDLLFTDRFQVGAAGVPGKAATSTAAAVTQAAEAVARQLARAILERTGPARR